MRRRRREKKLKKCKLEKNLDLTAKFANAKIIREFVRLCIEKIDEIDKIDTIDTMDKIDEMDEIQKIEKK